MEVCIVGFFDLLPDGFAEPGTTALLNGELGAKTPWYRCWVLMGLLFVGGVMNLVWILAITLFVLIEKLLPPGVQTARFTGFVMIASSFIYLLV
ncbi:MAG: hypothetical protein HOB98_00455 [Gammaproteobacteria bacterium]|nr:hypothetical protein [Gammaproteobacteria bacterium]MBT3870808.1 hypothetical protein [Gammaproteobacteria bacterium]MBT4380739.1 hypothetical protein [Gammaproteobacteria bacterium]MBT4614896.1 hypothetical protein [Gammaproteobacteria bacterium]MBT5444678.1 hypothetical protein [Gammaproteobacteria bacterium]